MEGNFSFGFISPFIVAFSDDGKFYFADIEENRSKLDKLKSCNLPKKIIPIKGFAITRSRTPVVLHNEGLYELDENFNIKQNSYLPHEGVKEIINDPLLYGRFFIHYENLDLYVCEVRNSDKVKDQFIAKNVSRFCASSTLLAFYINGEVIVHERTEIKSKEYRKKFENIDDIFISDYYLYVKRGEKVEMYDPHDDKSDKPVCVYNDIKNIWQTNDALLFNKKNQILINGAAYEFKRKEDIIGCAMWGEFVCVFYNDASISLERIDVIKEIKESKIKAMTLKVEDEFVPKIKECKKKLRIIKKLAVEWSYTSFQKLIDSEDYEELFRKCLSVSAYTLASICGNGVLDKALKKGLPEPLLIEIGEKLIQASSEETSKALVYAAKVFLKMDRDSALVKMTMKSLAQPLIDVLDLKLKNAEKEYKEVLLITKDVLTTFK